MASRESKQARIARIHKEYAILCKKFPHVRCTLNFTNPFELLIATVLSAQTTDKRVNSVTPELFGQFPDAALLAKAPLSLVEDIIHPLGFYRVKSRNIIALSAALVERFHGVVPSTMSELVTLPGVGRKTANVVLGNAFGIPAFPVDTHVMRVTGRLRWRSNWREPKVDPEAVEREITSYFPPEEWTDLSHRLIMYGRTVCTARQPYYQRCQLDDTCPSGDISTNE